jgi:hypothetical protein
MRILRDCLLSCTTKKGLDRIRAGKTRLKEVVRQNDFQSPRIVELNWNLQAEAVKSSLLTGLAGFLRGLIGCVGNLVGQRSGAHEDPHRLQSLSQRKTRTGTRALSMESPTACWQPPIRHRGHLRQGAACQFLS